MEEVEKKELHFLKTFELTKENDAYDAYLDNQNIEIILKKISDYKTNKSFIISNFDFQIEILECYGNKIIESIKKTLLKKKKQNEKIILEFKKIKTK